MRIFLVFLLLVSLLFSEEEYRLGEGVKVASLPLYIGGYASLNYLKGENQKEYRIDKLAFMSYGSYDKFSYMLELEFKELYIHKEKDKLSYSNTDTNLYTERLFLKYTHNENYMFRVGKYYSNIGFWNLLPINVLRETTSNPQSVYIIFPRLNTGIESSYVSYKEGIFKINATLQRNEGIDERYNNYNINKHYGIGLSYEIDNYIFKLNGGYFHVENTNSESDLFYMLLSTKYETDNFEFLAEIGSQRSENKFTTKYAGYMQGAYSFTQEHIAISRLESYEDNLNNKSENMLILGYTYRPIYPIAIKSEYQLHTQKEDNQFLISISVLF